MSTKLREDPVWDFERINRMNFRLIDHVFGTNTLLEEAKEDRMLISQVLEPLEEGKVRFRYRINPDSPNQDRTWNVIIQVFMGEELREIRTSVKVSQRDINTDYNIKNPVLIDRCNALLDMCRKKAEGLGKKSRVTDIDAVVRKLMTK